MVMEVFGLIGVVMSKGPHRGRKLLLSVITLTVKNRSKCSTSSGIKLWQGCLFDTHCHLNLVLR